MNSETTWQGVRVTFNTLSNFLIRDAKRTTGDISRSTPLPQLPSLRTAALKATSILVKSASILALGALMPPVAAQTWVGPGTDFNAGSNWDTGTVPGSNEIAIFSNFGPSELSTNLNTSLGGIVFASDAQRYNIAFGTDLNLFGNVENLSNQTQNFHVVTGATLFVDEASTLGRLVNYDVDGALIFDGASNAGDEVSIDIRSHIAFRGTGRTIDLGAVNSRSGTLIRNYSEDEVILRIGNLNTDMLLAGNISNPGGDLSIEKVGTGTLTLAGNNTHTGLTTITSGTLQVGNGGATGTLGSGSVVNNGSLIFNRTYTDINNEISGTGSVTIERYMSLKGANSYLGGTIIKAILAVEADSALGAASGGLTLNGGTLQTLQTFSTSRDVTLAASGGFAPANSTTLTLNGVISGAGSLTMNGGGILVIRGVNTYSGDTILNAGVISIAASSALGAQGMIYFNAGHLQTTASLTLNQEMGFQESGGELRPDVGTVLSLTDSLTGENLALNGAGTLILTGTNSYDTTTIAAGTLQVGNGGTTGTLGSGAVTNNASLVFNRSNAYIVSNAISGTGSVTQAGSGTTILTGNNTYNGATSINSGTLQVGNNGTSGSLSGTQINVSAGAKLAFSRSNSLTVANRIYGLGTIIQAGSGRLTLTSDLSDFVGDVSVTDGILDVQSVVGGPVNGYGAVSVEAGGALTGTGRVGITNIASEGQLIGNAGQTLHMEALTLNSESVATANLGAPSGTAASLFNVAGDLELNGQLNIVDQGGFGAGVYRLFDYGGQLTGAGLQFGDTPEGVLHTDLSIQTSIEGRVNLISSAGVDLRFWDGSSSANRDNNIIDGGSGTWSSTAGVWTDPNGLVNGTMKPKPAFTVFQGAAGTVTLDDSDGDLAVSGMQFITDGYALEGDGLTLAGTDQLTVIRVGDGSPADVGITATIGADLTSTGDLVKRDGGTLVLTGTNSYRDTVVVDGTLVGNSASLSGDIFNAGTVVFDQADDAPFSGTVAGLDGTDGRMAKRGTGTLTLTGNSGLDWHVEGGSLVTNTDLFSGNVDISEGANLTFNQNMDGIYAGVVNGAGELVLSGGTTTTFTGDSSAFGGSVDVRASSLVVNGALGGSVIIGSGSSLAGSGSLGNVTLGSGATIRPGNSIGTLAVGDITFATGSVFEVEVDATSNSSDLIAASGTATLNGGSVVHIGLNGNYRPTHTYTILTAAEGVNGEFADVTSDFAFLIPTLGYTGNEVTLTLARNDVNFDGVAQSFNQVATANALEAMGFGTPLYDVIIGLDEGGARLAFDGLSGEIHASVQSTLMEDSHFVRTAALDRMRSAGASVDPARGVTWWTQGIGSWGHIDGDGNASRITHSAKGVLMGFDTIAAETVQLGVYGGWQRSEVGIKRLSSDAKADGYHVGAYAGWDGDNLSLRGGVSYSWNNAEITRSINIADFSEIIRSDRGISQAQAFAEIAFPVEFGSFALEPFAGIAHVAQDAEAVNERGGDAALRVDHTTLNTTFTTMGARASNSFNLGGLKADIRASGGWRRALGDRMPLAGVTFEGSEPFSVRGVRVAKNAAALDAGLGLDLSSSARLEVAYGGVISSTSQSHSGRATFSLAF